MKKIYKKISLVMVLVLCITLLGNKFITKDIMAKGIKLSVKSKTIQTGERFFVTVKNAKSRIKVSVSKKKIIKVKKTKKNRYRIIGLKAGKTVITFKVGKKKYKCKVTVKKKQPIVIPQPTTEKTTERVTEKPTEKPTEEPTEKPTEEQTGKIPETTVHTHYYKNEIERKDPTCCANGYLIYQCDCGKTKKEALNATGKHKSSSWIIGSGATSKEEGMRYKQCILCHMVLEREVIPKLPNVPLETNGNMGEDNEDQINVGGAFQ